MPKIYANTKTLDDYISEYTDSEEEAEFLVLGSRSVDISKFKSLKGIFRCGVGTDNLPETDVPIGMPSNFTKNIIYEEVCAFTCSRIFQSFYSDVGTMVPWDKTKRDSIIDKEVLIIGAGNIGSKVREVLDNVCSVYTFDNGYGYPELTVDDLEMSVRRADIVTLHVPYTEETHEFIKPQWLKSTAVLVNTARGNLVNEEELYDFLKSNPKAKAIFDVFWKEPYDGKLLELDNFLATPHVASTCKQFTESMYKDFVRFMREYS